MKNKGNLKNRLVCLILTALLLSSIFSTTALAAELENDEVAVSEEENLDCEFTDDCEDFEADLISYEDNVEGFVENDFQIINVDKTKNEIINSIKSDNAFTLNGTVIRNDEQIAFEDYYDFSSVSKYEIAKWAYKNNLITESEKIDCYCDLILNKNFEKVSCLTVPYNEIVRYKETNDLPAELEAKIEVVLSDPFEENDNIGDSTKSISDSQTHQTSNFKIYYEGSIDYSEIVKVGKEFERVRSFFISLGYIEARKELFQSKYLVYIDDDAKTNKPSVWGTCVPNDSLLNVCSSRIYLYQFETLGDREKKTIAHEYFHAIHFSYNKETPWFTESFATWAGIAASGEFYHEEDIEEFIKYNASLTNTNYEYGISAFALAIELKYGRDAIRYIYEEYNSKDASNTESELRTVITNGIQATGTADNFYNAFLHMCAYNYEIEEWHKRYSIPPIDGEPRTHFVQEHIETSTRFPFSDSVNFLSSKRYSLEAFSGLDGYIVIEVTYGSDRGRTIFYKEYENASPGYSWQPTTNLKSTYSINLNQTNVEKLSIIVCNIGTSESMNYTVNVQFIPNGGYTTIRNSDRYWENRINIAAGETYEMLVEFNVSGYKTLTTFGGYNSEILLYDIHGNLLGSGGDNGVDGLALLSYNFTSNTLYRIKVSYDLATHYGITKLAIFPVSENYANIESILLSPMDSSGGHTGILNTNEMLIIRTSLPQDRTITFTADCEFDSFIYVIDTWASQAISNSPDTFSSYDDDSAGNGQATITKHLDGYVDYIIILCAYNPQTQSGFYYLTFDVTLT